MWRIAEGSYVVSVSELRTNMRKVFEFVSDNTESVVYVIKNSEWTSVLLSVERYEELIAQETNLRAAWRDPERFRELVENDSKVKDGTYRSTGELIAVDPQE